MVSLREQDLSAVRDACVAGIGTGPNNFELFLIPLGITEADLPPEFANAVRRYQKLSASEPIWPKFFYLLPSFAPPPPVQRRSAMTHNGIIVDDPQFRRAIHRVKIGSGDSATELGIVLWTYSPQHNDGDLLPGEHEYLALIRQAGGLLRHHKFVSARTAEASWLTFLADYLWNQLHPKVSRGYATVGNLWEESLAAIDAIPLPNNAVTPAEKPETGPGRPREDDPVQDRVWRMWNTGHFRRYRDLAHALKTHKDSKERVNLTEKQVEKMITKFRQRRCRASKPKR